MKCAIYCRLSREDGSGLESESITNQKRLLTEYAAAKHWELWDTYCDEDWSGISAERPEFCRLIKDASERRFGIVLCKTQSRFTRDMELVEKYLHKLFPEWGIRFIAIADNADTAVKGNKKARQIAGLVNEWYLEDLSDNIRSVLDCKRRNGEYIGSFALYGYKKSAEKGRLEIDEPAANVVRDIYKMYLSGMGKHAICRKLNEKGIPNPSAYKKQCGAGFVPGAGKDCSEAWSRTTVSRILQNEMYTGVMVQGRRRKLSYKSDRLVSVPEGEWFRVENTHEAIITREDFEKARAIMKTARGDVKPR